MKHLRTALLGLAAAGLLAACGGGGGQPPAESPQAANEVPASAAASPTAFTAYAASLQASDSATPLGMKNLDVPPTSETSMPMDL